MNATWYQAALVSAAGVLVGKVREYLETLLNEDSSQSMTIRLIKYGMTASMSRDGKRWDNEPTENFFNSLKNERVHGTTYATRAVAQADLFDYIEVFYNRSRSHSTLGYTSTLQFLENWISKHADQQTKAA